jgi:DNA-binding SARP family transcriptional activator/tetratricopeptide (TPR) repeat protein
MPLEFRVLGPLEVKRDGVALPLGGMKTRALLATLVIDVGHVVSTDALIDALWPTSAPADARHALEATVSRLRRVLGADAPVRNQPPGYVLDVDPQAVDAVRFRQLVAEAADLSESDGRRAARRADDALALWRGEPYAEFAFEPFARAEIADLVELRLQAEEQRIDALLAEGGADELVGEISALVAAEPTRERRREQLMRALYAAGRQADALAAFRGARTFLVEELGLEPGERLRELERAILRQDPALTGRPKAGVARPRTRRPATALVVEPAIALDLDPEEHERRTARAATLVARVADHYGGRIVTPFAVVFLDENHGATATAAARELAQSVSGRTGVATGEVLVDDEGIGGPLLHVARANLGAAPQPGPELERRDDGPFVGRAAELEHLRSAGTTLVLGPPGIGKSRLLRELSREARVVVGRCSAYGQEALAPLREIARRLDAPDALTSTPASDIPIVFRRLCEAAAPVTVAFDDLHWAYPIVVETVEHLVERAGDDVRVVCLAREDLLEERPVILPKAERLALEPLPLEDAVTLAHALGARDVSLVERAEGNPLFIEQLLAHAKETEEALPPTLHSLLASRLDRLAPTERSAVDCAAVAGREFDAALVAELLQVGAARGALDSLVRRGLIEPSPPTPTFDERYRFRHALIHEAAYVSIPKRELARLHEAAADAYDARAAADAVIGFHLERAAHLLEEDGRRGRRLAEEAGERLATGGIDAWKLGDAGTAVQLLERAVALLPAAHARRAELLCELGTALNTLGRREEAGDVLAVADSSGDRPMRLRARLERAALATLAGELSADEMVAVADDAAHVFEVLDDPRSLGRALMLAAWIRGGALAQHTQALEAAERALVQYQRAGSPASTCVAQIASALRLGPTPAKRGIERCRTLLESGAGDSPTQAAVAAHLGGLSGMTGDFETARSRLGEARSLYAELGRAPSIRWVCNPIEAAVARLAGDLEEAARLLESSCAELLEAGDTFHVATQAAELADVLLDLGRTEAAASWCAAAKKHRQPRDAEGAILLLATTARLTGDPAPAQEAVRLADETDALNLRASVYVTLADVLARDGDQPGAESALTTAHALYREKENAAAAARLEGRLTAAAS